jgi:hypothetical protein
MAGSSSKHTKEGEDEEAFLMNCWMSELNELQGRRTQMARHV